MLQVEAFSQALRVVTPNVRFLFYDNKHVDTDNRLVLSSWLVYQCTSRLLTRVDSSDRISVLAWPSLGISDGDLSSRRSVATDKMLRYPIA